MAKLGSIPAACMATTVMEVVEVFPWVPARRTCVWSAMRSASRSERRTMGIPCAFAAISSGLSCGIAAKEITTTSGSSPDSSRFSAACPMAMCAPMERSARTALESFMSEPLTISPRDSKIRATPDIPDPPIPTKWTLTWNLPSQFGRRCLPQPAPGCCALWRQPWKNKSLDHQ